MKKSKMPSIVSVLILTLITVVIWVTFDIYRLFNQADIPVVPESVSNPLTPTLNQDAITDLESRLFIENSTFSDEVVGPVEVTETIEIVETVDPVEPVEVVETNEGIVTDTVDENPLGATTTEP